MRTADALALGDNKNSKWEHPLDTPMQDKEQSCLKQP
jgi:hypothetical protein